VDTAPYRLVRHLLYLGELIAARGLPVRAGHWSHGPLVVVLRGLHLYRSTREEAVLGSVVPGYERYAAHVADPARPRTRQPGPPSWHPQGEPLHPQLDA